MARYNKQPTPLTLQNRFQFDRDDYLEQCRETAKRLLRHGGSITIEDVTKLCPRPTYLSPNLMGRIFDSQFIPTGFVKAKHAAAKGRWIRTWRLRDEK